MLDYFFSFAIGIVVLLLSANWFVKISSKIWVTLKISPLIIGATIVALGTSLPELTVSLIAVLKGDYGLATGNIIGSSIVNIFFVMAIGILMGHINVGINKTQKTALMMVLAVILYLSSGFIFATPGLRGLTLITLAIVFSYFEIFWGISGRDREDKAYITRNKNCYFGSKEVLKLVLVVFGVVAGGMMVVYSVEKISLLSGYSTTILGLSMTALATSFPELLTIIFCRKKDQEKVATGSILGSNVYNLLLIGGFIHLFSHKKEALGLDIVFLIFATVCGAFLVYCFAGRKVPKKVGLILLFFFIIYIIFLNKL